VSQPLIEIEHLSKRFYRTAADALRLQSLDILGRLLRLPARQSLSAGEFWALRDVGFSVGQGECIGIIGPNGAGKSTLLNLLAGSLRPDAGRIIRRGKLTSLIRLGSGLRPLLSGRENIYLDLMARGLDKPGADRHLEAIVAVAGLERVMDTAVRHYSDGLYARLEFALATALPTDILLIDEVLSVGDMAFQARSLERIRELKKQGTAVLMVSHAEMNIRWVADRCLLLFDGEMLGLGATDELYRVYYQSVGFRQAVPGDDALAAWSAPDGGESVSITGIACHTAADASCPVLESGAAARFVVGCQVMAEQNGLTLVLQFWNQRDVLLAVVDSGQAGVHFRFEPGSRQIGISLSALGLVPGVYRVAAGFRREGQWVCYAGNASRLTVRAGVWNDATGPLQLQARFEPVGETV